MLIQRILNKIVHISRPVLWFTKRKIKKTFRFLYGPSKNTYHTFAIVCVKRTPYVNLAINNINSLHLINNNHKFVIYCDDICFKELSRKKKQFDYLQNIEFYNKFKESNQPWQYSKIETIIDASKKDIIIIDADGLWHHDPVINTTKIIFQVSPKTIGEKTDESIVVKKIFNKQEWLTFRYYTSAFVSIPKRLLTESVIEDTYKYLDILFNNKYEFLDSQEKRDDQKRQSEQFAINLALLTHYPKELFAVLKEEDGAKNKNIVQPLYYGCKNKILE